MQNKHNTRTVHNALLSANMIEGNLKGGDPLPIACFLLPSAFWHLSFG
uniref:Uncharacterized protein n=1 Tax=Cryptococcus bacillisporus CA1280 TaxID=1296109 RepID=A0A0D0UNH7_CRYGA|nr:hypothetical protein I312_00778 [Cryptococcus bacillisporus CA1280]